MARDIEDMPRESFSPEIYPNQMGDDITKWRLGAVDVIESMEHQLKGEFLVKKTVDVNGEPIVIQEWEQMPSARFMNDTGAKAVVATSTMIINKVSFLSNVSEEDIFNTCHAIELSVARLIYDNWSDFEIRRSPTPIIHILMELVFMGLMRAKGGGERESLTKSENIFRQIREGAERAGGGRGFPLIGGGNKNENQQGQ